MSDLAHTIKTLAKKSEGFYSEKGSKFLGYAFPVEDIEEVKPLIDSLRKEHHTAVHVCFAHRIGIEQPSIRANDDGEPGHSAGTPILNQIEVTELHNTLIAVVRYYGGTKLGVPGLINAYKTAAADAINNNKIRTLTLKSVFEIETDYNRLGDVLRFMDQHECNVLKRDFLENVHLTIAVNKDLIPRMSEHFKALQLNEPDHLRDQLI